MESSEPTLGLKTEAALRWRADHFDAATVEVSSTLFFFLIFEEVKIFLKEILKALFGSKMSEDYKIPKLNGDNFHSWSIRARAMLVQKRCWEAVEPGYGINMNDNERKKNDEALTLLFLIVEDTFLDDIGDCPRAREAWNSLKDMHTKFGLLHVLQLMREFFNVKMKLHETVQSYLGRLMDLHRKLSTGGYAFTDREVALIMLIGLPRSYESLIINLEKDEEILTTAMVKSKLLLEEKRIARNENIAADTVEERALHTKNIPARKTPGKNMKKMAYKREDDETDTHRRKTKCFSCGEWGHISKTCNEARKQGQISAKTAVDLKRNWALSANEDTKNNPNTWILDSGATEHMTSVREKYFKFKPYSSTVEVANSEKIKVTGIGDTIIKLPGEAEEKTIALSNVLYVPNLGGNLLSIGRIEERGFKVEFSDGEAKILEKNGVVILTAKREGRLYVVKEKQDFAHIARSKNDELWHRRLGHPNYSLIKGCYSNEDESGSEDPPDERCSVCIQGKMKRKKFPKSTNTRAKEVLEIIHTDVVGKITPTSLGGANYFVSFTDDYSRYTTVYPIKTKDKALQMFDEYRRAVENLHNKKIKFLRSDNGREFRNEKFDQYLAQHGILRQLTVPESPEQNGISERKNQTLINAARCLLIESGLDKSFWAEAVSTATYLWNKCPSTSIAGSIPEEKWSGRKVDTKHLRVFGSRAWSHLRSYSRHGKFDPKATECVLLGYPEGVKGYRLWDLKNKKILISRDVTFEENVFPFKKEHELNAHKEDDIIFRIEHEEIEDLPVIEENRNRTNQNDDDTTEKDVNKEPDSHSNESSYQHEEFECNEETETVSHSENDNDSRSLVQQEEDSAAEINMQSNPSDRSCSNSYIPAGKDQTYRGRTIKPPKHLNDYIVYNARESECLTVSKGPNKEPSTVREALMSEEAEMWKQAMEEEIGNLQRAQTWELVPRPPNTKVITSRWIFRKKRDNEGKCIKFKARLVARGYQQLPGVDFSETYSPVIKLKSIRTLLAIAVEKDFDVHQMDITAAYLNGTLEEDVFMTQPEGCAEKNKEHLVCHLKKSLYGLKQSGRVWNSCLDRFLTSYGLKRSNADPCIYYDCEAGIIIGVYVDDLLIIGKLEKIDAFKGEIKKHFVAKDLGPASQILSMQVTKEDGGSITLDQTSYVDEILHTFKMNDAKPAATPLDPSIKYSYANDQEWEKVKEDSKMIPYRQAVGSLLYLACGSRPDLSYPSTYMSQFSERPTAEHWRGIKHILRYLKGTKFRKLRFQKTGKKLQAYSDADWGGDIIDRKSFNGYVILLAGGPVSWSSKKQTSVALSSTEAEYISMCHAAKEILWFKNLLNEICPNLVDTPQKILADNQGAIFISKNHATSERSKHIDLKYFFLRDLVEKRTLTFEHVSSENNIADVMTKRVSKKVLHEHSHAMTVE